MADAPRVTIMIVTFNRPDLLRRSLDEAGRQEGVELEVVVVDDHSDCDLRHIIAEYENRLHLRYFRLERNSGAAAARNVGIRESSNEIIIQLDDDSRLVEPDAAALVSRFMNEHRDVAALALRLHFPWGDGPEGVGSVYPRWNRPHLAEDFTFQGCSVVLRKAAAVQAGLYPPALEYYGEEDFLSARLLAGGGRILTFAERRVVHGDDSDDGPPPSPAKQRRIKVLNSSNLLRLALDVLPFPLNLGLAAVRVAALLAREPGIVPAVLGRVRHLRTGARRMSWREGVRYLALQRRVRRELMRERRRR